MYRLSLKISEQLQKCLFNCSMVKPRQLNPCNENLWIVKTFVHDVVNKSFNKMPTLESLYIHENGPCNEWVIRVYNLHQFKMPSIGTSNVHSFVYSGERFDVGLFAALCSPRTEI